MSQDDVQRTPPWAKQEARHEEGQDGESGTDHVTATPADTGEPSPEITPASAADSSETIGTGTSIALGCVAATILLIIFGLIFLALAALL